MTVNFTELDRLQIGEKISTADLVSSGRALGSTTRFPWVMMIALLGHMVFFVHKVFRPKLVPTPMGQNVDWLFLNICVLLFLGGGFSSPSDGEYDPKRVTS